MNIHDINRIALDYAKKLQGAQPQAKIGSILSAASPFLSLIPGVGPLAAAGAGVLGSALGGQEQSQYNTQQAQNATANAAAQLGAGLKNAQNNDLLYYAMALNPALMQGWFPSQITSNGFGSDIPGVRQMTIPDSARGPIGAGLYSGLNVGGNPSTAMNPPAVASTPATAQPSPFRAYTQPIAQQTPVDFSAWRQTQGMGA